MLSLDRQNEYRSRYKRVHPGWQTSGEVYESLVRRCLDGRWATAKVLDAGCGAGGVMELFSRQVALALGIDPDLSSLCGHRDSAIHLVAGRIEHLPFQEQTFDLVTSSWVFEHLARPELAFDEMARVLKRGGHLVFLTPNARNPVTWINQLVPRQRQDRLVSWLYGREPQDTFPTVYAANSPQRIDSLARSAGLRAVQVKLIGDPTYLAFNDLLFRISLLLERLLPPSRFVHIVGDYIKE